MTLGQAQAAGCGSRIADAGYIGEVKAITTGREGGPWMDVLEILWNDPRACRQAFYRWTLIQYKAA